MTNATINVTRNFAALSRTKLTGGTIDDMMRRLNSDWDTLNSEEKKKKIATVNVWKCNMRKECETQRADKRAKLVAELESCEDSTGEEANAIRQEIREHDKATPAILSAFDLNRRSRTGEATVRDVSGTMEQAILDAQAEIEAESVEA